MSTNQDARVVEFEKKYCLPQVRVRFPSSLYDVEDTSTTLRVTNEVYWLKIHIMEGLRFPFPTLVHEFLHYTQIHPTNIHVNVILVLLGASILNLRRKLDLGLEELLFIYSLKRHPNGCYFLMADAKPIQIITNLPDMTKHKAKSFVVTKVRMFTSTKFVFHPLS